jgi:hypothetical protein
MHNTFEKLFEKANAPQPPNGLFEKVVNRIRSVQALHARRRALWQVFLSIGIVGVSLAALFNAARNLSQSGFFEVGSVLLSDAVLFSSQSALLFLLETLPVLSLAFFLCTVGVLFLSGRLCIINVRRVLFTRDWSI